MEQIASKLFVRNDDAIANDCMRDHKQVRAGKPPRKIGRTVWPIGLDVYYSRLNSSIVLTKNLGLSRIAPVEERVATNLKFIVN